MADGDLKPLQNVFGGERFGHELIHAAIARFLNALQILMPGQHDDRDVFHRGRSEMTDAFHQRDSVHRFHVPIGHDQRRLERFNLDQHSLPVSDFF